MCSIPRAWVPWDWLAPYARIVHWKNTGAAFGMLQDFGNVFKILPFFVVAAILYYYPQIPRSEIYIRISMGMMMGGAIGNLIDRLTIGHVIDFVSLGGFPVFNVADASISIGTAILILGMWLEERKLRAEEAKLAQVESETLPETRDFFEITEDS